MNHNEYTVSLGIHEFEASIDEITALLGVQPSKAFLKGEIIPNRNIEIKREYSSWIYESSHDEKDYDINNHIQQLIGTFKSREMVFADFISKRYYLEISIVLYIYDNVNYGFNISNENMKSLSKLGLSVDVDTYCLVETE